MIFALIVQFLFGMLVNLTIIATIEIGHAANSRRRRQARPSFVPWFVTIPDSHPGSQPAEYFSELLQDERIVAPV